MILYHWETFSEAPVGKILIDFVCDVEFLAGDGGGDVVGLGSCCEFAGGVYRLMPG